MKYLVAGAPVYTLDERFGIVQAMVIEAGLIVAVGNVRRLRQDFPKARQVDISGGAIIPAFNDCHAHLLLLGQDLTRCDLGQCRTRGPGSPGLAAMDREEPFRVLGDGMEFRYCPI